ncbi:MAG: class F sortase [Streptosporangiales bacterium]
MELPRRDRRNGPARPVQGLFEDEPYEDENHDGEPYHDYEYQGYQQQPPYTQSLFADQNYPDEGYEDPRYQDRDYRGYEERGYRDRYERRRGPGRLVMVLGSVLALAGAFVIVRAVARSGQLYGAAERIPATVGTAMPTPGAGPMAAPLAFSRPVQIEIPKLNVAAPVIRLGLAANGAVEVPPLQNHDLAGWYDGSVTPGQKGTSVILGHVDSFTGISVFFYIKTLRPGNQIKILRANGSTAIFTVDGVQKVVKSAFPTSDVYGQVKYPSLRLITCGGPFDTATRQYLDNIVVYAHLTGTFR